MINSDFLPLVLFFFLEILYFYPFLFQIFLDLTLAQRVPAVLCRSAYQFKDRASSPIGEPNSKDHPDR